MPIVQKKGKVQGAQFKPKETHLWQNQV